MKGIGSHIVFLAILAGFAGVRGYATEQPTIIVAADGSGHFRTIQAALNSIPANNTSSVIVLVKKGTYHEKLFITTGHISLVGEDRDSTRIVYAELRSNWVKDHDGSDWGSAVINIGDGVSDVILANLTVHNNYGSHDHQFAIRGFRATRIVILYCNIIADGGDTLSLWNSDSGMYYHASCYFEGWVDYVCPRGWCYITDSRFFGHNLSASIWHDGSSTKNQKFVIRYSLFDGVPNFPLGRHHRDAQIYLLDCIFSRTMADRPIYSPKSLNTVPWVWGERHYFYNCHREGGDYGWFRDNLESAEGSPTAEQITARWTFDGKWDPEESMPSVLPFVSLPQPRNGSYAQKPGSVTLKWVPSRNSRGSRVHFGTSGSPEFLREQQSQMFKIVNLEPNTTYYWRVDEITGADTLRGPLWHFTTAQQVR